MRLFGRGKEVQEDNTTLDGLGNTALYTRKSGSAQEAEDRQNKGIDIDMIDPEEIIKSLETIAQYETLVAVELPQKDNEGNIIFEQVPALDAHGEVIYEVGTVEANGIVFPTKKPVLVNKPKIVKTYEKKTVTRPWAIAVLGYLNKVWPTIWMSPWEADTNKLRIRTAFHDIRKSMTFEEKQYWGVVVRMALDLCLARCEDMKEGRKPLLLKVRREEMGVHLTRGIPQKVGGK